MANGSRTRGDRPANGVAAVDAPAAIRARNVARLGAVFRMRRVAHDVRLDDVAAKSGLHRTTISAFELGRQAPSNAAIERAITALEDLLNTRWVMRDGEVNVRRELDEGA